MAIKEAASNTFVGGLISLGTGLFGSLLERFRTSDEDKLEAELARLRAERDKEVGEYDDINQMFHGELGSDLRPTYNNYFSSDYLERSAAEAEDFGRIALAAQMQSQAQFKQIFARTMDKVRRMVESRPYMRDTMLQEASKAQQMADQTLNEGLNVQRSMAASMDSRMGGAVTSILARTAAQQKAKVAASTAVERIREEESRKQLYRAAVQRQNQMIQSSLSGMQELGHAMGQTGMGTLSQGLAGLMGASSGITGMGLAMSARDLREGEQRLDNQIGILGAAGELSSSARSMYANLETLKRIDVQERADERRARTMSVVAGGAGVLSGIVSSGKTGGKENER